MVNTDVKFMTAESCCPCVMICLLYTSITKRFGTTPEKIRQDLSDRKIFLAWLQQQNIRDYRDVSQQIREFYSDPAKAVERAQRAMDAGVSA